MSNYIRLTKVLLKNGFGKSQSTGKRKKNNQTILYIIVALALLPMFFTFFSMANAVYDSLAMVGQQGLVLVLGFWLTSMLIFFFGFFYVINVFYFSSDIENLLPLPLRPSEILASKFTVALIYEYLTEVYFLLPLLVSFGIKSGSGIAYVIFAVIIFLTLPIIPLIYSSVINMLLMRFTNIGKRKDLFRMVGGIIAMVLGIGLNIVIQRFTSNAMSPEKLQNLLLSGNNSLVDISNSIFPSNKFAAISLINANTLDGLMKFGIYLGMLIVFVAVFLIIGEKLYFKGVIGVSEVSSRRRKLTNAEYNKTVVQSPVIRSYLLKELKLLIRTPVYFMNCILMNFLWPVFFLIPFVANPEKMSGFGQLLGYIRDERYSGIILAVVFGISMFISATNSITSTSISREGQNVYFSKFIPVSYKDQITAKLLSGIVVGLLGTAGMFVILAIALKIPFYIMIMSIILGLLAVFFTALIGLIIDLRGPKLDWDNEQKAVKQNLNSLINMLLCAIVAAVTVVPLIILRPNTFIVFVIITGAYSIIDILLYRFITTKGAKYYEQIDS